jgi:hypothetical protein
LRSSTTGTKHLKKILISTAAFIYDRSCFWSYVSLNRGLCIIVTKYLNLP